MNPRGGAGDSLLARIVEWARDDPRVAALALVGSHARGDARADSDVDLLLLCSAPGVLLDDRAWAEKFGPPERLTVEEWGKVTSVRVRYVGGAEVEFGVAGADWAADPADEGDARVVRDGIVILVDRGGILGRRVEAIRGR